MGPSSKQLRIPATTGTTETTLQHTKPRDEILSAPAPHTAPRNETFTAPARHKQPEFTHFHHAGANFLSQHTPCTHHTPTPGRHFFQTTGPSPHQTQAAHDPTTTGAQHCEPTGTNRTPEKNCLRHHHDSGAPPPRNLARNSIGRGFNKVRKRCNSNDLNSMFERVAGELRAKLGVDSAMRQARCGRDTCAVAGPGRASRQRTRPHPAAQTPPVWRAPEGPAAVPVGGGGAWPGFEPTRRAKLAARTARGRAGRAAAGDLSGEQATTAGITRPRGGRPRA